MLAVAAAVIALAALALWWAERVRWERARPVLDGVERARAWVGAYVALSPATFVYLFVLVITTWVLRSSGDRTSQALLSTHSTNLANLRADPVGSLVTSAFWLDPPQVARWAVLFALVLAPAERWLGTVRAVVAFATGHVLATLITAVVLDHNLFDLVGEDASRRAVDVGVSYGFYCVAALFTYRLPGRWRWVWAVVVAAPIGWTFLDERTFTSFGHLLAVALGFALYPMTRALSVRGRRALPVWRPPPAAVEASRRATAARRDAKRPG